MTTVSKLLEGKYQLAVAVSGMGLGTVDYLADTITLDARAAEIFDLPANHPLPRSELHARIHPDDRSAIDYKVETLLCPDHDDVIDVQHRVVHSDGKIVWVSARKQVEFAKSERDDDPRPVSGLVAIMDISAHKQDREKIEYLLAELGHRTKNMLAVVQSLARQTFRSGPVDTFQDRFSDRIQGLVRNADALVRSAWTTVRLDELARSHLDAFIDSSSGRLVLDGDELKLRPDAAQALGMALHELSTNAVKYGALSNDEGSVRLSWGHLENDPDTVEIVWREQDGPPVTAPTNVGFGKTVMTDMAASTVSGTVAVDYAPDGLVWRLQMPKSMTA